MPHNGQYSPSKLLPRIGPPPPALALGRDAAMIGPELVLRVCTGESAQREGFVAAATRDASREPELIP